ALWLATREPELVVIGWQRRAGFRPRCSSARAAASPQATKRCGFVARPLARAPCGDRCEGELCVGEGFADVILLVRGEKLLDLGVVGSPFRPSRCREPGGHAEIRGCIR